MGLSPLNFDDINDVDDLILSPEQSFHELVEGSRSKAQFSEWLNVMNSAEKSTELRRTGETGNRVQTEEVCNPIETYGVKSPPLLQFVQY